MLVFYSSVLLAFGWAGFGRTAYDEFKANGSSFPTSYTHNNFPVRMEAAISRWVGCRLGCLTKGAEFGGERTCGQGKSMLSDFFFLFHIKCLTTLHDPY